MSGEKFKDVMENAPIMWRQINSLGIILDCNTAYAEKLGYSKSEIIGKSIFEHISDDNWDALKKSLVEWSETGKVSDMEMIFKKKNGETFPVLLSATSIYDDQKNLLGSNTIIFDISKFKKQN